MRKIELSVGDSKPLRWWFYDKNDKQRAPKILTGHTLTLKIDNNGTNVDVVGALYVGDANVYFDIPAAIRDTAGEYPFSIIDIDGASDQATVDAGVIQYA